MKKYPVLAGLFMLFVGLCYSEDLISKYNYHFERKEYEQALSICETMLAAASQNLDLHREKAKMLAATNQREKFIQEMVLIRNFNNPKNGEVFFSILSHNFVTKGFRDDLRRLFFNNQDTEILLRWPKFADDKVVDCTAISESLKSPVKNSFSSSNSGNNANNMPTQNLPTNKPVPGKSNGVYEEYGPKIKGLSLGMNIHDALKVLQAKFPEIPILGPWKISEIGQGFLIGDPMVIAIAADKQQRVRIISISYQDAIFNTSGMDPDQFAQSIINAYKIPELKPFYSKGISGWAYSSSEGWKIEIFNDKSISLTTIAKASETKFD